MRQQQEPVGGGGDWDWELAAPSITQIIRSEERRGRGEAESMMGLMDGRVSLGG